MKETRSSETASSAPQSGLRALVGSVFTGDRVLWIIIAALAVISVLVVYSSTAKMAYDAHTARSTAHFLRQQVGILILCVPIIVIVHKINCRVYNRLAQPVYVLSLLLTLAVYFIGATTNGAARWIPVAGFQFQPSEALKVATILLLARRLSSCQSKIDRIRIVPSLNPFRWGRPAQRKIWREGTRPILLPVVLSCAVIFPAHTSSAMLVFLTSLVMMLIGRVRVSELVRLVGLACAALLLAGLLNLGRSETAGGRVSTWIDLWTSSQTEKPIDRLTDTERSMIAIHNGGLLGEGAGQSAMRVEMITIKNVCFSCFLREDTEKPMIKISLRSVGTFPCNQLAAECFNGGGHLNASGGEFFGTMEEAKAVFEKALEKYKPLLTAKS